VTYSVSYVDLALLVLGAKSSANRNLVSWEEFRKLF
jgi:hypothetical protein